MPRTKRAAVKTKSVSIELRQGSEVKKVKADTVLEGLNALTNDYPRAKAVMYVTKGEQKAELVLYPAVLRRLIANPLTRILMEKRLLTMLK